MNTTYSLIFGEPITTRPKPCSQSVSNEDLSSWKSVLQCLFLAALLGSCCVCAVPTDQYHLISLLTYSAQCLWTPAINSLNGSHFCTWYLILSVTQIESWGWEAASYRSVFNPCHFNLLWKELSVSKICSFISHVTSSYSGKNILMFSCSGIRQIKHHVTTLILHSSPWWECGCVHIYVCFLSSFENQLILRQDLFLRKKKEKEAVIAFVSYIHPKAFIIKCTLFLITSFWQPGWEATTLGNCQKQSQMKTVVQFHLNVNNKNRGKPSWANVQTSGEK